MKRNLLSLVFLILFTLTLFMSYSSALSINLAPANFSGNINMDMGGINFTVTQTITLNNISFIDYPTNVTILSHNGAVLDTYRLIGEYNVAQLDYTLSAGTYSLILFGGTGEYDNNENISKLGNVGINITAFCDYNYNPASYPISCYDNGGDNRLVEIYQINYTLGSVDTIYPTFNNYSSNNASLFGLGTAQLGVILNATNGSVYLYFNNTNYTATNTGGNVYNVSLNINTGNYTYYWYSYGNGTNNNYNNSNGVIGEEYTDFPVDSTYPTFANQSEINNTAFAGVFNITLNNTNGSVYLSLNGINYSATGLNNVYGVIENISSGNYSYYWFSYGNGHSSLYNNSLNFSFTSIVPVFQNTSISATKGILYLDFTTGEGIAEFIIAMLIGVIVLLYVNWGIGCLIIVCDGLIWLSNQQNVLIGAFIVLTGIILIFVNNTAESG